MRMFESAGPRVFALPPGADFPAALVDGVQARMAAHPPEAMAHVTLYLNTTRMRRAVREVFGERGAAFLPKLRLVTDPGTGPLGGLLPAMTPLRRASSQCFSTTRSCSRRSSFRATRSTA